MTELLDHWIDGGPLGAQPGRTEPVENPATGEIVGEAPMAGPGELDAAVAAAAGAFESWSVTPPAKRAAILFDARALIRERSDELCELITIQHGKVLDDARGELARGLEVLDFATGIPQLLKGDYSQNVSRGIDTHSVRRPVGICAGITPFNFPVMVPMWMFPLSIACGNAFILKPSERDPGPSLMLARLFAEAGLPPGVLNVLHGDRETVERILDHPGIHAVSFVGSTPVAKSIYTRASAAGKRVQALGGAKNHLVVAPDADLDSAADALVSAGYGSAGQRCMAISAAVSVGEAGDDLMERIADRAGVLRVGDGREPGVEMGPLITTAARDRVAGFVDRGEEAGAKLLVDGRGLQVEGHEEGAFIGPTLFDEVTPEMELYREEIFGPVLINLRSGSLDEAIDLINSNPYANGVAIFTRDGAIAREFAARIEVGMVGVNVPIPVPTAMYSFGGWRDSLFGDSHVYGPDGVHFYTRGQVVVSRWGAPAAGVSLQFDPGR